MKDIDTQENSSLENIKTHDSEELFDQESRSHEKEKVLEKEKILEKARKNHAMDEKALHDYNAAYRISFGIVLIVIAIFDLLAIFMNKERFCAEGFIVFCIGLPWLIFAIKNKENSNTIFKNRWVTIVLCSSLCICGLLRMALYFIER